MKYFLRCLGFLAIAFSTCVQVHASSSATNTPTGFRLTIELKDGSRIIGTGRDDSFQFHSETLGDFGLPLEKIRSIQSLAQTNLLQLTTTNADSLSVAFAMKKIRVDTVFGELKLAVTLIKNVYVSPFTKAGGLTEGLIGSWSGEGNGVDSIAGNNGVLQNVSFTTGVTGRAFTFSPNSFPLGSYIGIKIPDSPAYVFTNSLTIEGWIRPRGNDWAIFSRGDQRSGMDPYALSTQPNHGLRFEIDDENNVPVRAETTIAFYVWTHVAATFDGDAGTLNLYTNGVLAARTFTTRRPIGNLLPDESPGVGFGNVNDGANNLPFIGDIDSLSLYNRALSAEEINAIYNENAGNAGGRAGPLPAVNQYRRMNFNAQPIFDSE
jgi:hypothetical protein